MKLLDVRAPLEFHRGTLPGAVNLPLLTDTERAEVGTSFKREGRAQAIELGIRLLEPQRKNREDAWLNWATKEENPILFCARGGLRSQISQNWLSLRGKEVLRIKGGYKALRAELRRTLTRNLRFWILGGHTGSGKTSFLADSRHRFCQNKKTIDLEALANHRGSAFGKPLLNPQPSIQDFENRLALEVHRHSEADLLLLEDESKMIGKIRIPEIFYAKLAASELIFLDVPEAERIENILRDYVEQIQNDHGVMVLGQTLFNSLSSIKKKLGMERFTKIFGLMERAIRENSTDDHRAWIRGLLREYYDPMYEYSMKKKNRRIRFRGPRDEVVDYLNEQYAKLAQ